MEMNYKGTVMHIGAPTQRSMLTLDADAIEIDPIFAEYKDFLFAVKIIQLCLTINQ